MLPTLPRLAAAVCGLLLLTALLAPAASAQPLTPVGTAGVGIGVAPTPTVVKPKKKCYKTVKLRSGKKVKRVVPCRTIKVKKTAAVRGSGYTSSQASCRALAFSVGARFGITPMTGPRANRSSDHNRGMAWDFMVRSNSQGDAVAAALRAVPNKYVLWEVPEHYDHAHLSCA